MKVYDGDLKLGYFFTMENPEQARPYREIIDYATQQAILTEQGGFDAVWTGEHHFSHEGINILTNPIIFGTHLAGKTSTIRIGFAGLISTQWHPLRLAEDVAMLDQLSGGRVNCGLGRGIVLREMINLNLDADRRNEPRQWALFRETVDIIKQAWTEEPFTYKGLFYRFPHPGVPDQYARIAPARPGFRSESGEYIGMSIEPKPFQKPHPPLFNVVDQTPGFVVAAELGMQPITWLRSTGGIREAFAAYRTRASELQSRDVPLGEGCGILRIAVVADTMEEARKNAEPAVDLLYRDLVSGGRPRNIYADPGETLTDADFDKPYFDFLFERDHLLVGTPDFVAERILHLRQELGFEHLLIQMWAPHVPDAAVFRSIELFCEEVIPIIRGKKEAVPAGSAAAVGDGAA
jgi:alkanesulfonate monooxygenase SsuD/methylene tetrahydromethanopterin reductase-like flavin-dependent oxidoreductase (luciferase family)